MLIQLFQRRALTYTPSNSAAFQVEMGNIGQHYYVWRYGFDTRDQLPGNDRLIFPQGASLYSINIRKVSDKVKLGDAPATIDGLWTLNEGRAVVKAGQKLYLVDLTKARAFKEIPQPANPGFDPGNLLILNVASSPDGRKVAINIGSLGTGKNVVEIYNTDSLAGDNLNIASHYTALNFTTGGQLTLAFSADSRYLALGRDYDGVAIFDTTLKKGNSFAILGKAYWLGTSSQLMVTTRSGLTSKVPGKITLVDAATGDVKTLVESLRIREAMPSPDGHYFALREVDEGYNPGAGTSLVKGYLTFRTVADPTKDLYPDEQGTTGRYSNEPTLVRWNADGTFIQIEEFGQLCGRDQCLGL